ncbi:hypothetical protein MHU86_4042 [Fragilaria crotonensis]|nr:hypothetical protein MHU86_4042 [Fragilaria crotonensis]
MLPPTLFTPTLLLWKSFHCLQSLVNNDQLRRHRQIASVSDTDQLRRQRQIAASVSDNDQLRRGQCQIASVRVLQKLSYSRRRTVSVCLHCLSSEYLSNDCDDGVECIVFGISSDERLAQQLRQQRWIASVLLGVLLPKLPYSRQRNLTSSCERYLRCWEDSERPVAEAAI